MIGRSRPPVAKKSRHSYSHHGRTVHDDYAWLRDPNYPQVADPEILGYLNEENLYFEKIMAPHKSLIDALFHEIKDRQPTEESSVPFEENGFFYQWRFHEGEEYRTWYRAPSSRPEDWSVLLDERELAAGSDYFSLGGISVSDDGNRITYSVDRDGSERFELFVEDIQTGEHLSAQIPDTLGQAVWNKQNNGFLYVVLNENWRPFKVLFKDLTSSNPDVTVYEELDDSFFVSIHCSQSDEFVFVSAGDHVTTQNFYLSRDDIGAKPASMTERIANHEYSVDHDGERFLIRSNLRQANFDLYVCQIQSEDLSDWTLLVEGSSERYITDFLCLRHFLVVMNRIEGLDQIEIYETNTKTHHQIVFPDAAYTVDLGDNSLLSNHFVRLEYSSMTSPSKVLDYDLANRSTQVRKTQRIPSGYSQEDYVSERIQAKARDGSMIPISLVYHRDTNPREAPPMHLYAYGAYGHAVAPTFSTARLSLLDRGFICGIAHIRGGDDLGYHWYTQGKLMQRCNTFNDFVDCAKHLVDRSYSAPGKIFISGGSAGGELMGAAANQSPELWGAVAAHVPFVDVLNTMLNADLPLTPIEWPEWGNPIEDAQAFDYIRSYSPYDQIEAKEYPPIFATAGLNDPRVTYWEPAKWIAKLRATKTDNNLILLKTNMAMGHGGKSGRYDSLREIAEEYVFFLSQLEEIKPSSDAVPP
ncbi:S9 family peptidase [Gammaproteobacteria bacterium]|nr:S9 family peptidase [Gammaproteobacteria bacterium]